MADDSNNFGDYLKAVAVLTVAIAGSNALNSALQGKQKNAVQAYPLNQPIMPVNNFVGDYSKTAGGYVFRQKVSNNFATIQAISEGRLDSFNGFYLADDKVTLNGSDSVVGVTNGGTTITDGRYQDDDGKIRVKIQTRLGLPTETAYSDFTTAFSDIWDSSCRGDNTGSIAVQRFATDTKFQSQIFPAGPVDASAVARGVCFDWRDETQDRLDDTTWKWSRNPIVWLVHKEWTAWGRDWEAQILPNLADLTDEADFCETAFPLKAGGTQDMYGVAFNYPDDEEFTVTRQRILDAMDGFYAEDGYGRLILKCGHYEEPTVTFTGDDILASHWEGGELSSDAVDQINISFISPDNDYKQVPCDPWIINEGGTLSTDLGLDGVDNMPQARFLAKRKSARLMPAYRGSIRVGRKGRQAMGQPYIRVQNPRRASMADVVCEITNIEYEPSDRTFTISLISADANIDAWNPATEEGNPVDAVPGVDPGALDTPTIDAVVPFYDGSNVRLKIITTGPDRGDLTWSARWRVTGSTTWNEGTYPNAVAISGGQVYFNTGVVTMASSIDVEVFYMTGGGSPSPYSSVYPVNTAVMPSLDLLAYGVPSYRAADSTTYASFAAMVAASRANFSRASVASALNTTGYPPVQFISGAPAETDRGILIHRTRTNLLLNSSTLSTQSVTVTAQAYTLTFYGSGSVTLSGAHSHAVSGAGAGLRQTYTFTPSAGTLTLTVSGSVTFAQLEAGAYATAWIPTTGASVARASDAASITGISSLLTGDFSLVAEIDFGLADGATSQNICSISDGTNNNRVSFVRTSSGSLSVTLTASGTDQDTYNRSIGVTAQRASVACTLRGTEFYSAINGVLDTTATGVTRPTGLEQLVIGGSATGASPLDGYIRRLTLYPALTPEHLALLTA